MNSDWQPLADALRAELSEYGALVGLFDTQQHAILGRDSEAILLSVATIEEQMRHLAGLRDEREALVRAFAAQFGQPPAATLRSLLPFFAADARPLLEALIDEINHLVHRTRRRSRQNHLLLARAVEVRQELLQTLRPDSFTKTYSARGRVALSTPKIASAYQAAG
ncbi:MAG: flagellar protein FlgN [Opitutae bacterium]|nr:flagellar protein FlgN [Opitutae bacterium]